MEMTTGTLARFKGGQIEIRNARAQVLRRGEIVNVEVIDGLLRAQFAWMAEGEGGLPAKSWVACDAHPLSTLLRPYVPSLEGDRIKLYSAFAGEVVMFYPPGDDELLDPSKVRGSNVRRLVAV